MKYYQQSLSSLVKNASKLEKKYIRNSNLFKIMKLIEDNLILRLTMKRNWVLHYLCGGKGVIPYKKIKFHEDLDAVPKGIFFSKT